MTTNQEKPKDVGHLTFNCVGQPNESFQLIVNGHGHEPEVANALLPDLLAYLSGGPAPTWWDQTQMRLNEHGRSFNLDDKHYVHRCPSLVLNEATGKWETFDSIAPFVNALLARMMQGVDNG